MPDDNNPFPLTDAQQERLRAVLAAWEEGEDEERLERLRRHEEDREILRAFARLLQESHFAQGNDLPRAHLARLLTMVRALAPNPNLDSRLLQRPGEPETFNRDLRDLLYGAGSVPLRLRAFLLRRHAGEQTATQLLCAAFPAEWPLITRAGLRALDISAEQRAAAIETARSRFDLPEENAPPPSPAVWERGMRGSDLTLRVLADVVTYEAVRELLALSDYVEVHRLLTQGTVRRPSRARQREVAALIYAPVTPTAPTLLRESPEIGYNSDSQIKETSVVQTAPPDIADIAENDVLTALEQEIAAQGFTYPPLIVRDYYISLQTKPFVLIAGLTGTGKTRLTSLFAESLTGNAGAQYRLLPVRPDWADSTPLLGYVNLLAGGGEGRFVPTPFLEFLRRADRPENAHRAFFLCLDEMNLARIEHYFAEILSAMETPTHELILPNGQIQCLPANLFLIGTLNLDESTHTLPRKVLDRANTLAFHEVCLRDLPTTPESPHALTPTPAQRQAVFLHTRVPNVAAARAKLRSLGPNGADFALRVIETLAEVNDLLQPRGLHVAYRVRDEVLRYCANSFDRQGHGLFVADADANLQAALDLQLQQKVLPRLSGTQEQIETPARDLMRWAEKSHFVRTAQRLGRLLARVQREGFVSFEDV